MLASFFTGTAAAVATLLPTEESRLRQAIRSAAAEVAAAAEDLDARMRALTELRNLTDSTGKLAHDLKLAERAAQEAEDAWARSGSPDEPPALTEAHAKLRAARLAHAKARAQAALAGAAEADLAALEREVAKAIDEWAQSESRPVQIGAPREAPQAAMERLEAARVKALRYRRQAAAELSLERKRDEAQERLKRAREDHEAAAWALVHFSVRERIESLLTQIAPLLEQAEALWPAADSDTQKRLEDIGVGLGWMPPVALSLWAANTGTRKHRERPSRPDPRWNQLVASLMTDPEAPL